MLDSLWRGPGVPVIWAQVARVCSRVDKVWIDVMRALETWGATALARGERVASVVEISLSESVHDGQLVAWTRGACHLGASRTSMQSC